MTAPAIQWGLDIIAEGDRLTHAAIQETADMNEARLLVHGVMARALRDIGGPVSPGQLDVDMNEAIQRRARQAS